MPRNPKAFRIAADTGAVEYDDSVDNIIGKCPSCSCFHSGAFDTCDECLEQKLEEQHQAEQEYYEYMEQMAEYESGEVCSIFSGRLDYMDIE